MALSVTTSKNWTPATRQEPLRERTVSRMQRLRRRLSLGRLSLSKEVILPDADNEQRVTLNGFERVADASQLSPVGEDAPLPPPRTSSLHSGLDRPPHGSSVKAGWLRPTPHSSSFDGSSTTERRPVCRPARPKSEVLLSQHKATQAARSPSMLLENLLISEQGELKLADFGLARAKSVPSRTYSHEVVTLWYRPPDVLLGSTDYSTSLDMCEVLGTPTEATWEGVSRLKNYKLHKCGMYPGQPLRTAFPKLAEVPQADEMANRLLQLRPQDRISASEALHQLYFADLPPQVHQLPDQSSLFTIAACKLAQETYNMPLSVMKAAAKLRC
ncbi:hypothetical protein IscW_ISCW010312 [Ixodes scapularis]|uniref:Protein kinase domain-containing protein n=1 Tax=Ixodes scapularis TaxID=6945 RepID=B7Q2S3_IXOSC|nr:hypothetical protein IscW_ISCW010312 [Ixodes scapularis]|eukprot:XP_002410972.1 hypothetical protein IscW_ISCW010312 [Ixodes scapularis]